MDTPTMTRCPDPSGPVNDANGAISYSLQFSADGRYLAQIYQRTSTYNDPLTVGVFRRDGDQLVKLAVPQLNGATQGMPMSVTWHPSGAWLIVSVTYGSTMDLRDPSKYPGYLRLWVYHRSGDTMTLAGPAGSSVFGYYYPGSIAFDATGQYAAVAAVDGVQGLVSFNTGTGAMTLLDGRVNGSLPGGDYDAYHGMLATPVWHPTDPTLVVAMGWTGLVFQRRVGDHLEAVTPALESALPGEAAQTVMWHPSGDFLLLNDANDSSQYGLLAHRYRPALTRFAVTALSELAYATGFAMSPGGRYVAGGPVWAQNPRGGSCGCCDPGDGGYLGLTVTAIEPRAAGDGSMVLWPTDIARPGAADQVPGEFLAFTDASPTVTYLAASTSSYTVPAYGAGEPWGVRLFRLDSAAAVDSSLFMKMPDGQYTLVGTVDKPLSFRMPDGTTRAWPGSSMPLYQKMPDGSWRQVIG